jgi:hypothetical protein
MKIILTAAAEIIGLAGMLTGIYTLYLILN